MKIIAHISTESLQFSHSSSQTHPSQLYSKSISCCHSQSNMYIPHRHAGKMSTRIPHSFDTSLQQSLQDSTLHRSYQQETPLTLYQHLKDNRRDDSKPRYPYDLSF